MFHWRITKYNPQLRNSKGWYLKDEWTSISDIDKIFDDGKLTFHDYINIENAYVNAITAFMECNNIDTIRINKLSKNSSPRDISLYSPEMLNTFNNLADKTIVDKNIIQNVARLALREELWCKLITKNMYVHFGYDYYMYIGSSKACDETINHIENSGLFVEKFVSPYL